MGLFGNKNKSDLDLKPGHFLFDDETEIVPEPINYNTVLEYLAGLSAEDYKKVIKCAEITRKSYAEQCKVLDIENEPTTFIYPPEPPTLADSTFTDDEGKINLLEDDTELGNYLDDDHDTPASRQQKETAKKAVKINKTEKPKK